MRRAWRMLVGLWTGATYAMANDRRSENREMATVSCPRGELSKELHPPQWRDQSVVRHRVFGVRTSGGGWSYCRSSALFLGRPSSG